MVRRLCPLFAALLLASPRARAQEPYTKDWGVRGEHAVGEMQGLDVGGVPADLYCATSDRSITPLVVVVGEIGSSRSAARAFARHLASHGMPVLVPAQDHPDPGENARRVARAQAALGNVILALPPAAPCAGLRACMESGGVVGGTSHCYRWSAPSIGAHVVIGSGVVTYLHAISQSRCESGPGTILLDPDTAGLPLPDLERCGMGVSRAFPPVSVVRSGLGACRDGFEALADGPLDSSPLEVTTVHGARHCDALPGDSACVARCGPGAGAGAPAFLFRYVTARLRGDFGAIHGWENRWLYPEQERGRVSHEYREPSHVGAVTGFNISLLLGIGGRDSSESELGIEGVAALRPELIFGRTSRRSLGVGPYLEAGWLAVSNVSLGTGASLLVPVGDETALVPSLGAYAHRRDDAWRGGGAFGVFFGHRQLNDISAFDAASGFRLEARADFDGDGERAVWLGYQLDLTAVAAMAAFGASL